MLSCFWCSHCCHFLKWATMMLTETNHHLWKRNTTKIISWTNSGNNKICSLAALHPLIGKKTTMTVYFNPWTRARWDFCCCCSTWNPDPRTTTTTTNKARGGLPPLLEVKFDDVLQPCDAVLLEQGVHNYQITPSTQRSGQQQW